MNSSIKIAFLSLFLASCSDNSFYLDRDLGHLIPCGSNRISNLEIRDTLGNYYFFDLVRDSEANSVNLLLPTGDFFIKNELGQTVDFILTPRMMYFATNDTHGDAAAETIEFTTDLMGRIDHVSERSCRQVLPRPMSSYPQVP